MCDGAFVRITWTLSHGFSSFMRNRDCQISSFAISDISLYPRVVVDGVLSFLVVHTPCWFCETGSGWTCGNWWSCCHSSPPGEKTARPLPCFHGFDNQWVRLEHLQATWESSSVTANWLFLVYCVSFYNMHYHNWVLLIFDHMELLFRITESVPALASFLLVPLQIHWVFVLHLFCSAKNSIWMRFCNLLGEQWKLLSGMMRLKKWQGRLLCPICATTTKHSNSRRWLKPVKASEWHIVLCWSFLMAQDCRLVICYRLLSSVLQVWGYWSIAVFEAYSAAPATECTSPSHHDSREQIYSYSQTCLRYSIDFWTTVYPWCLVSLLNNPCGCPMCPCTVQL